MDVDLPSYPNTANVRVSQAATVQEIPDEDSSEVRRFVEEYSGPVAKILGEGETIFNRWKRENEESGRQEYFPFAGEDEWELAIWLIQNVGHNKIEEFLKLKTVSASATTVR